MRGMKILIAILLFAGACSITSTAQSSAPSGVLLATRCEGEHCIVRFSTFWIIFNDKKVAVRASGAGLLTPRADGFWWVGVAMDNQDPESRHLRRPDSSEAGTVPGTDSGSDATAGANGPLVQPDVFWAVPSDKRPTFLRFSQEKLGQLYEGMSDNGMDITFLSPEYVGINQHGAYVGGSIAYVDDDKIVRLENVVTDHPLELKSFSPEGPEYERADERCRERLIAEGGDFNTPEFLGGAERFWRILRGPTYWTLKQTFRYDNGAARGYSTECLLPRELASHVIGFDHVFIAWSAIKKSVPLAKTALQSPDKKVLLVFDSGGIVRVFLPQDYELGPEVSSFEVPGSLIMAQWATGRFVEGWDAQLRPLLKQGPPAPVWKDAPPDASQ